MNTAQISVEELRKRLIEDIQTLPAEALQAVAEAIKQLHGNTDNQQDAEQPSAEKASSPYEAFQESGLIGCIKDAPPDLSVDYKHYLVEGLAEKYGNR